MRKPAKSQTGRDKNKGANQVKSEIIAHINVVVDSLGEFDQADIVLINLAAWIRTMDDRAAKVPGGLGRK